MAYGNHNPHDNDDDDLVPDSFIDAINLEYQIHPDELGNEEKTARRLLRESLPAVTMMVTRTALSDPDSRVRLTAANMVFDRVLGKAGTTANMETSPQEELYKSMMTEVQAMLAAANQ